MVYLQMAKEIIALSRPFAGRTYYHPFADRSRSRLFGSHNLLYIYFF
jgi:hypothetical protein